MPLSWHWLPAQGSWLAEVMISTRRRLPILAFLLTTLTASISGAAGLDKGADTRPGSDVAVPDGYRLEHYRAPVPAEVPGATTVTLEEAEALHRVRHRPVHRRDEGAARRISRHRRTSGWSPNPMSRSRAAHGCRKSAKEPSKPEIERYFRSQPGAPDAAATPPPPCSSTASPIAGCRGTRRSARCPGATAKFTGTATVSRSGSSSTCRPRPSIPFPYPRGEPLPPELPYRSEHGRDRASHYMSG